ncbi:MAG: TetR/AcrR family transcriptional regulator C-terminal domain-containing protein [Actinomycetota bacterium]|nr:TetR/AcrR family transcriptional regulator C-terminal domain-containing protein [Actinomycetota bacterium]
MARARTAKRTALSRQVIVTTALELLDQEGLGALSMRRLADALGVGTMSVYSYVADKADLIDGVAECVLADVRLPSPGDPWVESTRRLAHSFRGVALSHPAAFQLLLARGPQPSRTALWAEVASVFREAGLSTEESHRLFRAVSRFVIGWCLAEISDTKRREGGDEDFAFSLDALLDGLERRLPRG